MSKLISVVVTTLDSELAFSVPHNTIGNSLFDQVTKTLNLREVWYFGLLYFDSKSLPSWLKHDRKILNQDVGKSYPLKFKFCIKYYPEDVETELIQEVTQRLFYLQVRNDILSGTIYAPPETCVLLASYSCQAKYGDYKDDLEINTDENFPLEKILPKRITDQFELSKESWLTTIVKMYKNHNDMMREEAIMEYLKLTQDLEMFGVNYFDITNKKGSSLLLGVDSLGLNIYEKENKLTPSIAFPWSEIKNVSYKSKKFIIKSSAKSNVEFSFYTDSSHINKIILQMATGNHDLYMKRRKPDTIEIQQMKAQAQDELSAKLAIKDRITRERMAKEDVERRLAEMEDKLKQSDEKNEENQIKMREYEIKIKELEDLLRKAELQKLELEEMRRRLEENNEALVNAKGQSEEEYQKLMMEKEQITQEIERQNDEVEKTKKEVSEYQEQLDRYQREKEELETKLEKVVTDKEKKDEDEMTLDETELPEDESLRQTQVQTNMELSAQLDILKNELEPKRNTYKLEQIDLIHQQNQKTGRDKFQTLREIRQGTVKKRADLFMSK